MATTLTVKDGNGTSQTLSAVADAGNSSSLVTAHILADAAGSNKAKVDAQGGLMVSGEAAAGVAVAGNPVLVGGSDGTNAQSIATDTSGHQKMVGAGASGAALVGNPVLVAGSDGTNAQSLSTDASGRQIVVGAVAAGVAAAGNPVLTGGTDGTNAQITHLASAANLNGGALVGSTATVGALIATKPGMWQANNTAAAAGTPTCNPGAPGAGKWLVLDSATFSLGAGAAAQTPVTCTVSDGTLTLWSATLAAPADGGAAVSASGLNIPTGAANRNLTMTTTGSVAANTVISVAMSGYVVG